MNSEPTNTRGMMEQNETCDCCNVAGKGIHVDVFYNFNELAPMQQEWDNFVESVGAEIFLTYDWCRIWWKYYGKKRDLRVFVFHSNKELVGIIPLFFEKIWLGPIFVRAAKIVGSDFTIAQFSLPISSKYIRGVIQKLFELLPEDKWDILHIGPIAGLYKHYDDLENICEELLGHSHIVLNENKGVQTYFQLATGWAKQLTSLKKGERWDIKRSYKALQADKTSLVSTFASEVNFEELFENFVNMHQSYWRSLGKLGHFGDWPVAHEFHHEIATAQLKQNRLRLLEVKSGTRCLGYEYNYKFGDRYFEFLNARSTSKELAKISVGRVVFSEQVKKSLDEGVRCIDSMRGKYEHKLRLGGTLFPIRSLYIIPNKLSSVIRVSVFRAFARFLNLCYYKIWFCRVAPRLSLKRRPLWKIWIRTSAFG